MDDDEDEFGDAWEFCGFEKYFSVLDETLEDANVRNPKKFLAVMDAECEIIGYFHRDVAEAIVKILNRDKP